MIVLVPGSLQPPCAIAHQAPLPMVFPMQEYWSGLPYPLHEIFLAQGENPCFLCLPNQQVDSLPIALLGKPHVIYMQLYRDTVCISKFKFLIKITLICNLRKHHCSEAVRFCKRNFLLSVFILSLHFLLFSCLICLMLNSNHAFSNPLLLSSHSIRKFFTLLQVIFKLNTAGSFTTQCISVPD